jgi:subtilisin family serine protease
VGPLALLGLALSVTFAVRADERGDDVARLLVPQGPVASSVVPLKAFVEPGLAEGTGEVEIVVQTLDTPLVVAHGEHYKQFGGGMTRNQQREHLRRSRDSQEALLGQIRGMGGRELGRVSRALVAVAVSVDASKIDAIAELANVRSVRRVHDYQVDLTETVPYIGAKAVQDAGVDGKGVRVAVLDSGIDYTHSKLGGSGSVGDYSLCYATNTTIGDCAFYPNA